MPSVVIRGARPRPIDHAWQLAYRVAYGLALIWWFLRRPQYNGALMAVWHGGEILMLSTSYRRGMNLPGGGIQPGENAQQAALRETAEEIGLVLAPDQLQLAGAIAFRFENRHDHVTIFETFLAERPSLVIDHREIVAAYFRAPASIRPDEVPPHVARYLAAKLGQASSLAP
ncbi:MAG: hydrolase [Rhodospirillales bacterium]|jgi:8-oxo-dGTP diphosphatase|nr:hydrolase [Rhodospirillales bacterium]